MGSFPSKTAPEDEEETLLADAQKGNGGGGFFSRGAKAVYIDPPMPDVGMKVDYDKLLQRKLNVKKATKMMFQVINNDTQEAVEYAKKIPTSENLERVKVTDDVVALINERQTAKDDRQFVKDNLLLSQKYLSLRKSALNMMNHNYMDVIVRKLDTVLVQETRTILNVHAESHLKDDNIEEDEEHKEAPVTSADLK